PTGHLTLARTPVAAFGGRRALSTRPVRGAGSLSRSSPRRRGGRAAAPRCRAVPGNGLPCRRSLLWAGRARGRGLPPRHGLHPRGGASKTAHPRAQPATRGKGTGHSSGDEVEVLRQRPLDRHLEEAARLRVDDLRAVRGEEDGDLLLDT